MTTSVSVFGLGYVGCVSAACFAKEGFTVIGVDVSRTKVNLVNRGEATIVEAGIGDLVREMVGIGRLRATNDVREAVHASSIALICVGTPSRANSSIDLAYVRRVSEEIGAALKDKDGHLTIVVRSTVLPGSTEEVVIPALEEHSGKRCGIDFDVCMNPEFLREGSSIKDFYDPPFTVIGSQRDEAGRVVAGLYAGIGAAVHVTPLRVAEMMKYASNCFHGLKVAFANEIGNVCKALGIDSHEVMKLVASDTKLNVSPAYLKPGYAFGGSCLPKDLRAIVHRARQVDVDVPVLAATLDSNRRQVERAIDMVLATGRRRVGLLGLSFKAGTDDLRESPLVALVERLIGKGLDLAIFDNLVSEARLVGANREFIEREVPHIWSLMHNDLDAVLSRSDVVVIGNGAREFADIGPRLRSDQVVVDLVRVLDLNGSSRATYQGICW